MAKKLEVRHLTISFRTTNGAVRAVRDISFDLNEGETLAIAGESGSGKSVTTRAVMGILAGNAIVEDGEVIYDGKDLLKIPEEEFHTLRGHKLSMVFQDPLSALNPIMRIGKQLTEAMILNNKERRSDGHKRFNEMLGHLERAMAEAEKQEGKPEAEAKAQASELVRSFKRFVDVGVKMENTFKNAQENAIGAQDLLEEVDIALLKRDVKAVRETVGRLCKICERVYDPWLIPENDQAFHFGVEKIKAAGQHFTMSGEGALREAMEEIRSRLNSALEPPAAEVPNFFRIGYLAANGETPDPGKEAVSSINARARETMDKGLMDRFLACTQKALKWSDGEALKAKKTAVAALEKALPVFRADPLDRNHCEAAAKQAAEAVEKAIDPLALDKDNQSYVFRSSILGYIERYFSGLKQNPREQKRYDRDVKKHDADTAKGKFAPSVVPLNLVDTQKAKANMAQTIERLRDHFNEQLSSGAAGDGDLQDRALALVDYLKDRASEYAYRLGMAMARHRAIELMKEVGIPEPHKRYHQYPFEFSGGMRQRIVIAIALSANPDILICDEPTTALDVTIQAQILELINRLKKERRLSVIFITHDLGVVANMADRIAIMYAGKIVEYGTADDVFYDPRHPYTWALLASMPDLETREKLDAIPGMPPNMILPPKGDAFAARNKYAMEIDFEEQPPQFRVSDTHWAATWLLHPDAPKVDPPAIVTERIRRMQKKEQETGLKGGAQA